MWIAKDHDSIISYKVDYKAKRHITPTSLKSSAELSRQQCKKFRDEDPLQPENPLLTTSLDELEESLLDGNSQRIAEAWNSLGLVRLHTQHNPEEALRCHENALNLLSSLDSHSAVHYTHLATTLHDVGLCYERLNNTARALEYYGRAARLLEEQHFDASHERLLAINRAIARVQRR